MKAKKRKNFKGYTLVEILVVVFIIILLVYAAVPEYNRIMNKTDVSDALHKIEMFSSAQEKFFIVNGKYTKSLNELNTPLKGDGPEISTTNFLYYAGDLDEDDYCIYSESKNRDYTLAKNYKNNSEVFCFGTDCNKIKSFVKQGDSSTICAQHSATICDLTCHPPLYLDEAHCACAQCNLTTEDCKGINLAWGKLDNCTCGCLAIEYCQNGKTWNSDICKCECPTIQECAEGKVWDNDTCQCTCSTVQECSEGQSWDSNLCTCVEQQNTCSLTDEQCKNEKGEFYVATSDHCSCECSQYLLELSCKAQGTTWFDMSTCSCIE